MYPLAVNAKYTDNREVFNGWKEIANYLGKGVRTVQRYERALRLPVRRPAGKAKGSVLAIKAELDLWVLSASMRGPREMPEIILRVAENEMDKLEKAIAQTRKLQSETKGLREEFSVLRDSFSHHMQLVRGSLALNDSRKSNVTSIDSVPKRLKRPAAMRKRRFTL